ncbi:MAG: glyoxalase [Parafilimonas sp.]
MEHKVLSMRPFIGAKNYDESRSFYRELGFVETVLSDDMSVFKIENFAFYLQNAYIKDWIDNTQIFLEVDNVERYFNALSILSLQNKYKGKVRLTPIKNDVWGSECFLHDPSGILWHFGEFKK